MVRAYPLRPEGDCTRFIMTLGAELGRLPDHPFVTLILDNEVTLGHFVTAPPLPWVRLTRRDGLYRVAEGYPALLTAEQARFEMKNWDQVSLPGIMDALRGLDDSVDYVLIGNNAGQGFPFAESLPPALISGCAAVIYGESLPEIKEYERIGCRTSFRRDRAVFHLLELAGSAGRPLALYFINTIQHNRFNYHDP